MQALTSWRPSSVKQSGARSTGYGKLRALTWTFIWERPRTGIHSTAGNAHNEETRLSERWSILDLKKIYLFLICQPCKSYLGKQGQVNHSITAVYLKCFLPTEKIRPKPPWSTKQFQCFCTRQLLSSLLENVFCVTQQQMQSQKMHGMWLVFLL